MTDTIMADLASEDSLKKLLGMDKDDEEDDLSSEEALDFAKAEKIRADAYKTRVDALRGRITMAKNLSDALKSMDKLRPEQRAWVLKTLGFPPLVTQELPQEEDKKEQTPGQTRQERRKHLQPGAKQKPGAQV